MKKNKISIFCLTFIGLLLLTSCIKEDVISTSNEINTEIKNESGTGYGEKDE